MTSSAGTFAPELLNAFQWPSKVADALIAHFGREVLRETSLCQLRAFCTFFSGIGTFEIALDAFQRALSQRGVPCNPELVYACDIDETCQRRLLGFQHGCVFGNIFDFLAVDGFCKEWCYGRQTTCNQPTNLQHPGPDGQAVWQLVV